jgi:hypothetical protein
MYRSQFVMLRRALGLAATALYLISGTAVAQAPVLPLTPVTAPGVSVKTVARGLEDPRGLAFGPDRQLYVAEAGTTQGVFVPPPPPVQSEPPTRTRCEVYWPAGPATPGFTGRISRVDNEGTVTAVAEGLASFAANNLIGGDRISVSGVAFRGNSLYTMMGGAGCSHGHPSEPNGLRRVFRDGTTVTISDLSNYLRSNVDSKPPTDADFEPDGVWYNLVRAFGAFYTTEPNHGIMLRIENDGAISASADLYGAVKAVDHDGDHTYSALAKHRDALFVGTVGRTNDDFKGAVYRVSRDLASVQQVASGLHGVLGIAFDRRNRMYVLETTATGVSPPFSSPSAGRVVRIERDGSLTPIVTNLSFPTALIAGPGGEFYVSTCGYHCDDRSAFPPKLTSLKTGEILRVHLASSDAEFEQENEERQ